MLDQGCADRVEHDIAQQFQQMGLPHDVDVAKPSLKQMATEAVPPIKLVCIFPVQVMHRHGEICMGRFEQQMEMIWHQAYAIYHQLKPVYRFGKDAIPDLLVDIVGKYACPTIATRGDVVDRTWILMSS